MIVMMIAALIPPKASQIDHNPVINTIIDNLVTNDINENPVINDINDINENPGFLVAKYVRSCIY